jgi:predicted protein tyrosine phosphatase
MKSNKPKKMPASIAGKYSNFVALRPLFSEMLATKDREAVCDAVAESLSKRYGMVYITRKGEDVPITKLREESGMHTLEFIDLLYGIDEYGGSESLSIELASAMQPYWNVWWDQFSLVTLDADSRIIDHVLGKEQILWISAQIARRATRFAGPAATTLARALEVIEDWIAGRSSKSDVKRLVDDILDSTDSVEADDEAPFASVDAVMAFCDMANDTSIMAVSTFQAVVRSTSYAEGFADDPGADDAELARNRNAARSACADVARAVFTPTLITTASRGLR